MVGNKKPWFTFSYKDHTCTLQLELIIIPPNKHAYIIIEDEKAFIKKISDDGRLPITTIDGLKAKYSITCFCYSWAWVVFTFREHNATAFKVYEIIPL